MKVIVGCEFSGAVRRAFRKRNIEAWSCDLLPSDDNSEYHIVGDILEVIAAQQFDLGIFHPPCTYLANSSASWLYKNAKKENGRDEERFEKLRFGAEFFKKLLQADIPKIAVENPIMLSVARDIIGRGCDQIVQPWMFGHGESKATCFHLKNLPRLKPTNIVFGREQRLNWLSPSPDRAKRRSVTYPGIAEAMAEQWGFERPKRRLY